MWLTRGLRGGGKKLCPLSQSLSVLDPVVIESCSFHRFSSSSSSSSPTTLNSSSNAEEDPPIGGDTCVSLSFKSYESKSKKVDSPLLIQHNLLGCKNNWTRLAKELNQMTRRKVISVDCRNHGESPHHPEMTYAGMSLDVQALIQQQQKDQEKFSFMGAGMGGRVGMYLALTRPDLVDKLIVLNSTPLANHKVVDRWNDIRKACLAMKEIQNKILSENSLVSRKSLADLELKPVLKDSFDRSLFLTNLTDSKEENGLWRLNLDSFIQSRENGIFPSSLSPSLDKFTDNKKFDGPVLFITGEHSNYLRKEDEDKVKKYFPQAQFTWIPNSGYWVHAEKYPELLEALLSFLSVKR